MVTDVVVGTDRIMLTAYNPRSAVTLLKCRFLLETVAELMGQVSDDGFHRWLVRQPGGRELLERLQAGWEPDRDRELTVDPRNAREEARIVAWLLSERRAQLGTADKRDWRT